MSYCRKLTTLYEVEQESYKFVFFISMSSNNKAVQHRRPKDTLRFEKPYYNTQGSYHKIVFEILRYLKVEFAQKFKIIYRHDARILSNFSSDTTKRRRVSEESFLKFPYIKVDGVARLYMKNL